MNDTLPLNLSPDYQYAAAIAVLQQPKSRTDQQHMKGLKTHTVQHAKPIVPLTHLRQAPSVNRDAKPSITQYVLFPSPLAIAKCVLESVRCCNGQEKKNKNYN